MLPTSIQGYSNIARVAFVIPYINLISCSSVIAHAGPRHPTFIRFILPLLLGVLLEGADEATGGRIVALAVARLVKLLENLLCEDLAQLDTPLVKAVDVPDGTLGEGEVLVVDDQGTQLSRADGTSDQDGSRRAVAQESLVRDKLLGGTLGADLIVSLANHQCLSLGKIVGCKHLLVEVVGDGVVRLGGKNEVGGDQLGALVDKLKERVLSVGAGLSEQDGA